MARDWVFTYKQNILHIQYSSLIWKTAAKSNTFEYPAAFQYNESFKLVT